MCNFDIQAFIREKEKEFDERAQRERKAGRQKICLDLCELIPEKKELIELYFNSPHKLIKNNKFNINHNSKTFKSNGKFYNIKSWGKTFVRATNNQVFKNEVIEEII